MFLFLTGVEINLPSTLSGEVEESKIGTIKVSFWECRATFAYLFRFLFSAERAYSIIYLGTPKQKS